MKWKRCYGIEHWTFAEDGKMEKRMIRGNDLELGEILWGGGGDSRGLMSIVWSWGRRISRLEGQHSTAFLSIRELRISHIE